MLLLSNCPIMGADGHPRLREAGLGGVTRTLLASSKNTAGANSLGISRRAEKLAYQMARLN
jgi:hypothetical protein